MNWYEARQERRRERLEERAARLRRESESAQARAHEILDPIPLGQPILVGHHSEGRHRRALRRADDAMRRACERDAEARETARRAAAVGSAGISSDDPDAPDKIRERLAELEASRAQMKAANAAWRKAGRPGVEAINKTEHGLAVHREKWRKIQEAAGLSDAELLALLRRMASYWRADAPYPTHAFTNMGANIRRLQGRLAEVEAGHDGSPALSIEGVGWRIYEDRQANRLCWESDGKPPSETRATLKRWGFRWAPSEGRWQRMLNNAARHAAECLARELP